MKKSVCADIRWLGTESVYIRHKKGRESHHVGGSDEAKKIRKESMQGENRELC